jgi:dihydrofolate reductase
MTSVQRKVVLYHLLSLDGVAEEPSDWFIDGGPEVLENLGRTISTQDDVLLGRATYDDWAAYWPGSTFEPFASFINGVRKHVVTSNESNLEWANSSRVTGLVNESIAELKKQPGRDIGIHGSITLAQSLLCARLVDELRLVVAPTLAGRGRRLFPDDTLQRLELADVARSAKGTIFLTYYRPTEGGNS